MEKMDSDALLSLLQDMGEGRPGARVAGLDEAQFRAFMARAAASLVGVLERLVVAMEGCAPSPERVVELVAALAAAGAELPPPERPEQPEQLGL